jgi:hypothetical protein
MQRGLSSVAAQSAVRGSSMFSILTGMALIAAGAAR